MAYDYGYGQPKDKKSIWDTLTTGVDKYFTLKTAQEQQELAKIRLQQLVEQGKLTQQQADLERAKLESQNLAEMSATERFMAKLKANKTIVISLLVAGLAVGGFVYYKKKK